jgi:hypothetical protein
MNKRRFTLLIYSLLIVFLFLAAIGSDLILNDMPEISISASKLLANVVPTASFTPESTISQQISPSPTETTAATETPTPAKPANTKPPPSPTPAATLLPTLPPVISAGWEGLQIETVCLAVWDHYPQSVGAFTRSDEIAAATSSLLSLLGIQTVPLGEPCEAQLTLLLSFRAVGTQYSGDSVLYTGAQSEGQLTLSAPEHDQLVVSVNGLVSLPADPASSGWQPESPSAAPYELVWREPVLSGLVQIWGEDVLRVIPAGDEWEMEAGKMLRAIEYASIPTQGAASSGTNNANASLVVQHHPNPAAFLPGGVSNQEFTCYFQSALQTQSAGVHIKTFGMDLFVDGLWVSDPNKRTGPWTADEFADWYDCPGAFIPAGESCTDPNNWLGRDNNIPFKGLWYYRGVDEFGHAVSAEAEIECGPE